MPRKTITKRAKARLRIGLVYDLRADYLAMGYGPEEVGEFDSISTINELDKALTALGYRVERIGHGRRLAELLVAGRRWDLVFTIAEGLYGRSREAQVPAMLELYGQLYTFSDPLTSAVTLDKAVTKRLVAAAGLYTPRFAVIERPADLRSVKLAYPVFAKPIAEGTGKGVDSASRIDDARQLATVCTRLLKQYRQPVLVEEYLPGREFTTAILGTGPDAEVLGTMEMTILEGAPAKDYSFEVKEMCEKYVHYFEMPRGRLRKEVEKLALGSYRALECRDTSRGDTRLDREGKPAFLEVNPLPGLHPSHSDLPMIATQQGMPYVELIGRIVTSALKRKEPLK